MQERAMEFEKAEVSLYDEAVLGWISIDYRHVLESRVPTCDCRCV
jgi:hypothetical protein